MEHKHHGSPNASNSASAPIELEFPTPPPAYSECEPSYPQNQQPSYPQQNQPTFSQNQQTPFTYSQQRNLVQQPQVQHVIVLQVPFEQHPLNTTCPSCHATIVTKVRSEPNIATHAVALLLCLVFPLCSCLPYCMTSCQNTVHSCPNCAAYIGSYRPGYRY